VADKSKIALEAALRNIAALAAGPSRNPELARKQIREIEATARDALGQKHHLTTLGYGPKSRLS
jgi:voltage-gated potassium channel Kch